MAISLKEGINLENYLSGVDLINSIYNKIAEGISQRYFGTLKTSTDLMNHINSVASEYFNIEDFNMEMPDEYEAVKQKVKELLQAKKMNRKINEDNYFEPEKKRFIQSPLTGQQAVNLEVSIYDFLKSDKDIINTGQCILGGIYSWDRDVYVNVKLGKFWKVLKGKLDWNSTYSPRLIDTSWYNGKVPSDAEEIFNFLIYENKKMKESTLKHGDKVLYLNRDINKKVRGTIEGRPEKKNGKLVLDDGEMKWGYENQFTKLNESKKVLKETSHEISQYQNIVNYEESDIVKVIRELFKSYDGFVLEKIQAVGEDQYYNLNVCYEVEDESQDLEFKRFTLAQKMQKFRLDIFTDLSAYLPVVNINLGSYDFVKNNNKLKFVLTVLLSKTNIKNWVTGTKSKVEKDNASKKITDILDKKTISEALQRIEVEVPDAFAALDKARPIKGIKDTNMVTATKVRVRYDDKKLTSKQIIDLLK